MMSIEEVTAQAKKEIAEEKFRQAVEAEKTRLRQYRPLWVRVFPWRITIKRR